MRIAGRLFALALAVALIVQVASGQVQRSGGGANMQLMQEYQQAVSERDQLKDDNSKLKKDLDDAKKQLEAAQKQLTASKVGASRNEAELAAAQTSSQNNAKALADLRGRAEELVARFRDTVKTLQGVETDRAQLKQQLGQSQSAYDKCAVTNDALYQVASEVLDRYQHQGAFSYLARSEPFTKIKQTQIDNLVVEYRERAEELRLKKATPAAPTASH